MTFIYEWLSCNNVFFNAQQFQYICFNPHSFLSCNAHISSSLDTIDNSRHVLDFGIYIKWLFFSIFLLQTLINTKTFNWLDNFLFSRQIDHVAWHCLKFWICFDRTMVLSWGHLIYPNTLTWLRKINGLSQYISLVCKACHIHLIFWSCIISSVEERNTLALMCGTFWSAKFQIFLTLYVSREPDLDWPWNFSISYMCSINLRHPTPLYATCTTYTILVALWWDSSINQAPPNAILRDPTPLSRVSCLVCQCIWSVTYCITALCPQSYVSCQTWLIDPCHVSPSLCVIRYRHIFILVLLLIKYQVKRKREILH